MRLVRFDLLLVALGSIGLLFALLNVNPKVPRLAHQLAVAGIILFSPDRFVGCCDLGNFFQIIAMTLFEFCVRLS